MNFEPILDNLLFAVAFALIMPWVVVAAKRVHKVFARKSSELEYYKEDFDKVIEKCKIIFPEENINFQGKFFNGGIQVRVITKKNKIYEGWLVGQNKEKNICVITDSHIVVQDIRLINEILPMEN